MTELIVEDKEPRYVFDKDGKRLRRWSQAESAQRWRER